MNRLRMMMMIVLPASNALPSTNGWSVFRVADYIPYGHRLSFIVETSLYGNNETSLLAG